MALATAKQITKYEVFAGEFFIRSSRFLLAGNNGGAGY
jgi:hypothetical protein